MDLLYTEISMDYIFSKSSREVVARDRIVKRKSLINEHWLPVIHISTGYSFQEEKSISKRFSGRS